MDAYPDIDSTWYKTRALTRQIDKPVVTIQLLLGRPGHSSHG
jgi:hypothetical protein